LIANQILNRINGCGRVSETPHLSKDYATGVVNVNKNKRLSIHPLLSVAKGNVFARQSFAVNGVTLIKRELLTLEKGQIHTISAIPLVQKELGLIYRKILLSTKGIAPMRQYQQLNKDDRFYIWHALRDLPQ